MIYEILSLIICEKQENYIEMSSAVTLFTLSIWTDRCESTLTNPAVFKHINRK